jgi:hypothetical protein
VIAHIVTFVWKDGTEAEVAGLGEALQQMADAIPALVFYRAGPNLRLRPNGADFAVLAVAADAAGIAEYLDAPAHVELVAARIAPNAAIRQAVQLDLGDAGIPAEWVR